MQLRSATRVRGLLRCLDAAFFIPSFEEEGYVLLGDLREDGQEVVSDFVAALAMPRDAGDRLLAFAFPGLVQPDPAGEGQQAKASSSSQGAGDPRPWHCSRALDAQWLQAISPLYSQHMGCENMGPFLYSLVRFLKPTSCLEIGAGYTSAFLLQALADNAAEARTWSDWCPQDGAAETGGGQQIKASWLVLEALPQLEEGVLHCVDNLAHAGTTAPHLVNVAEKLGLQDRLRLHLDDARAFLGESVTEVAFFDFVWLDGLLDFAPPQRGPGGVRAGIDAFLAEVWPRVAPGGHVLLHSTVTNSAVREWLDGVQSATWGPPGAILSLLEPHKRFQNSVTLLQKRPPGYAEPIYSKLP